MNMQSDVYFDLDKAPMAVSSVTLTVHGLDRMVEFYTRVIGLSVHHRDEQAAMLGAEAPFLNLVSDPEAPRAHPRAPGLFHVAYLLPRREDLVSWLGHVANTKLRLAGASDHNVSEAVYLQDPEGNGIEIYADRAVRNWTDADGALHMPSEPLDLSGLPDPQVWSGAPAKTRIGHVHLQTTEIPASEAFWTGLGMEVMARYPDGSFFGSGGYHHQIAANVWNSRGQPVQTGIKTGLREVTLAVDPAVVEAPQTRISPSGVTVHLQARRN